MIKLLTYPIRAEKEETIRAIETKHTEAMQLVDDHYRATIESLMHQLQSQVWPFSLLCRILFYAN